MELAHEYFQKEADSTHLARKPQMELLMTGIVTL